MVKSIESLFAKILNNYQNRFVSRYLILTIDLIIVSFSYLFACLLIFDFNFEIVPWHLYKYHLIVMLIVRMLFFYHFRAFRGIVRHTSMEDIKLIFHAVTLSFLVTVVGSKIASAYFENKNLYIPTSILTVDYFTCLFLLTAHRLFIRSIYLDFMKVKTGTSAQPVIIFGAGSLGIITKNVLLQKPGKYSILCFADDNPSMLRNSVEGVLILDMPTAIRKHIESAQKVPQVVLAVRNLSSERKKELTNQLLQYRIVPKIVPSSVDPLDENFSSEQIRNIEIEDLLERPPIEMHNASIQSQIEGKVIMITGASGSIGSQLSKQLMEFAPKELILLDHYESGIYELENYFDANLNGSVKVSAIPCNISDPYHLHQIFENYTPDIVFHAAAYKHVPLMEKFPYLAVKNNVFGTKNVADLSAKFCVDKFILVSTDKAVNPTNVMGATKRLAEIYVQQLNDRADLDTKYIVTRFGNVLGSNGSVVPLFASQIQAGGPVTVTHRDIIRYFMTIKEACQLVVEASLMGNGGEIFVFDMGEPVRIQDLARKMIELSGFTADVDIAIEYTGLRPGEKLYEELLSDLETTLPTYHAKIKIALMQNSIPVELNDKLELLAFALKTGNPNTIVSILKSIVPEFVSNNSMFEALDIKPKITEDLLRQKFSA